MSMTFAGPGGSFERRWIVYAMLRDNVQHHLEGGTPSSAFSALHRLSEALLAGKVEVPALALRDELERARRVLELPISDFAVSDRTRAVCTLALDRVQGRSTALATAVEWEIPYSFHGATSLADIIGDFHSELLQITEKADASSVVEAADT